MNLFRSAILCFFVIAGCSNHHREALYDYNEKHQYILTEDEINLLDSVQYYSFLFFINERNEQNGLVKDRSASWSPASVASIGFAIPSYAVGVERGWMSREDAASFTLAVLKFFYNSSQSSDTNVTGYKGFYYHFLKMNSGIREWNCELSTIDTGLLMMGIIFARNYYNLDIDVENQIRNLSDILVERLDWEFFKMPGNSDYANTISMGWRPEEGMHKMGWSGYNEALFLYVLAAGSGMKDAEAAYEAWLSTYKWFTPYPQLSHVAFPPIFGHIFSFCFLNPHGLKDDFMKKKGIDYFENSRRAVYVQRQYAIDNPKSWEGYDSLCWGISACDGPGDSYNFDGYEFFAYAGRGTSGPELVYFDDGTITPYASVSSILFAPEIVIPTIKSFNEKYAEEGLWGPYGYYDAFNLTAGWYDKDYIGIDQGPIVLMIENFRSGMIWKYVMADPIIQQGFRRLGFTTSINE
jgi:hypothetical protein